MVKEKSTLTHLTDRHFSHSCPMLRFQGPFAFTVTTKVKERESLKNIKKERNNSTNAELFLVDCWNHV